MKKLIVTFLLIISFCVSAQQESPKREMRGAWIATVLNLDWPSSNALSTEQQKAQLINILDQLKAAGVNAVYFQVRVECDAFYQSSYDPWSYWLTGQQGRAPNPFYDPLKFAIEEAHKRGMELHAWINPYRVVRNVAGTYPKASNHVTQTHPDWILQIGNVKILDPGLPQVRDYVTNVVMDIVNRYDVDGIHFDDYFYESGITTQDANTFKNYARGFTNLADWRRDNVNLLVAQIYNEINKSKLYVKFGISPPGMWKSNNPPGICGYYGYSDIYADGQYWLQNHIIDYIAPQLYHAIGSSISCGSTDYNLVMKWWASHSFNRHVFIGQAAYRISDWSASELPNQIRSDRNTANIKGGILYRTNMGVLDNPRGFLDSLKNDLYHYPALIPRMDWKDTVSPNNPQNLRFARLPNSAVSGLIWDLPSKASDGDSAYRYVVYNFDSSTPTSNEMNQSSNILDIAGERTEIPKSSVNKKLYFGVSSLDRNWNESGISNVILINSPAKPGLVVPTMSALHQRDTVKLIWNYADNATSYHLQIGTDSTFSKNLILDESGITDTTYSITNLLSVEKYFWRVQANNLAGLGDYSATYNFTTGFPGIPVLVDPPHTTLDVSNNPILKWQPDNLADSYQLQLSIARSFDHPTLKFDSTGISDTTMQVKNLDYAQIYFWRVRANNQYGYGSWSDIFGFKTEDNPNFVRDEGRLPSAFNLDQNYPNPFNPSTTIKFAIPKEGYTSLIIYDMLGRIVSVLINQNLSAGNYSVNFDATHLTSGIYIYRLVSGTKNITHKMMLVK